VQGRVRQAGRVGQVMAGQKLWQALGLGMASSRGSSRAGQGRSGARAGDMARHGRR
jgi:hypothetical protein